MQRSPTASEDGEPKSDNDSRSRTFLGSSWARLCGSPLVRRLRTQRHRRWLVVSSIAILAAVPVADWVTGEVWVAALLLVPYLGVNVLMSATTGGLLDRRFESLDERERLVRLTVFREPYVVGVTIGIIAGWLGLSGFSSERGWNGMALAILASVYLVPVSALAWQLPDEPDDEV